MHSANCLGCNLTGFAYRTGSQIHFGSGLDLLFIFSFRHLEGLRGENYLKLGMQVSNFNLLYFNQKIYIHLVISIQ